MTNSGPQITYILIIAT